VGTLVLDILVFYSTLNISETVKDTDIVAMEY